MSDVKGERETETETERERERRTRRTREREREEERKKKITFLGVPGLSSNNYPDGTDELGCGSAASSLPVAPASASLQAWLIGASAVSVYQRRT